jgi:colanic acid/amylovoran biosynthesis glycosyltransferase
MSAPLIVAYIFERYPVLYQTFLRREVAGVCAQGVRIEVHSMIVPSPANRAHALKGVPVDYFRWWEAAKLIVALPRELLRDPTLLRDGWRLYQRYRPTNPENFWTTVWAAIYAVCRANRFRQRKPDVIHGVWATGPATAAAILSRLCGIPFSFGGHAHDIYRHGGDAFLEPKLRAASFVHTTTEVAANYLRDRAISSSPPPEGLGVGSAVPNSPPTEGPWVGSTRIVLARRGLDQLPPKLARDSSTLPNSPPTEGAGVGSPRPIRLLSVGRLVPKKGHIHQLAACALLKSWGVPFVARIVGDGPLYDELQRCIDRAGLEKFVSLTGPLAPQQVDEQYQWADVFWHTDVVDAEDDRDGIPNVIPEAFARCLPVISSRTAGPMEAVAHEVTGLLADPTNTTELAGAVKRLADDAKLRQQLADNGRRWVEENFLISHNAAILAHVFRKVCRQ